MNGVVIMLLALILFVSYYSYGFTCSDFSGSWGGDYIGTYCDGYSYSGKWEARVYDDCRITISSEGEFSSGTIDPNTKTFTVAGTDSECGNVTYTGTFTKDFVSGYYTYSAGGNGNFSGSKRAQISTTERAILFALYNTTNGNNWLNNNGWKDYPLYVDGFSMPGTECNWYGITCDTGGTYIESISLPKNNLSGNIPPEVGKLANLEDVTLRDNNLSGKIPPEIGKLTKLMYLYLYGNELSGKIPSEIGNLINLRELYLNDNELIDAIPKSLLNLQKLTALNIRYNHLYTNDAELRNFLNSKQIGGNWENSQTPPFKESIAKPWIPLLLLDD